jgi:hypothetical protein
MPFGVWGGIGVNAGASQTSTIEQFEDLKMSKVITINSWNWSRIAAYDLLSIFKFSNLQIICVDIRNFDPSMAKNVL